MSDGLIVILALIAVIAAVVAWRLTLIRQPLPPITVTISADVRGFAEAMQKIASAAMCSQESLQRLSTAILVAANPDRSAP